MTGQWWSQPFAAEGSSTSEGIKNLLGRPDLDPLVVLVREAAQNSWDARRADHVVFSIDIRRLGAHAAAWRSHLLPEPDRRSNLPLADNLMEDSIVIRVSDRGTTGLGGPIRADLPVMAGENPDFVSFIRNVGEPRDKALGGGTYGFGKGVFYGLSRTSTILLRTRCTVQASPQIRFMGAALGHSFDGDVRRFTGRHWWGLVADDVPDPLIDLTAEAVAADLGLEPFGAGYGTDVLVIGADLGWVEDDPDAPEGTSRPRTVQEAAETIASGILWNLWPKFASRRTRPPDMTFVVRTDETVLEVPEPGTVPELMPFVEALNDLDVIGEEFVSGGRTIGRYARAAGIAPLRPSRAWIARAAPFQGPAHHCALMRQAELIVKYVEGPTPLDEMLQWAAVFRSDGECDEYFARSEPPTHDDWVSRQLDGPARRVVHGALVRIGKRLAALAPDVIAANGGIAAPLGALSGGLASLLPTAEGSGGRSAATTGGGGGGGGAGRSSGPLVRFVTDPTFVVTPQGPRIVALVEASQSSEPIDAHATAVVLLDGGRPEGEAPEGADRPSVLGWASESDSVGTVAVVGDHLRIEPHDLRRWRVIVQPTRDAMTGLSVRGEASGGGIAL